MQKKGTLIVFEGPDGVGKTTIANMLASHYTSLKIRNKCLAFPGNDVGTLGYLVYDIHHHPEKYHINQIPSASLQLLHIAAHIDAIQGRIRPLLNEGYRVILDRYWWSTWVYGIIGGANLNVVRAMVDIEKRVWAEIKPSCIIMVDRSQSFRRDEPESRWRRLRSAYKKLALQEQRSGRVEIVKNERNINDALNGVLNILESKKKR